MKKLFHFIKYKFTQQYARPLTANEQAMAKSVFGESLDVSTIQLKTAWWVLKGYAVAPNGNVYFHKADWQDDFALQSLGKRAWLIHELTHAWQVQQGMAVFWRALVNRRYAYNFNPNKSFFDYGVEQQAKMVEDYYIHREKAQDCTDWLACVPFLKH